MVFLPRGLDRPEEEKSVVTKKLDQKPKGEGIPTTAKVSPAPGISEVGGLSSDSPLAPRSLRCWWGEVWGEEAGRFPAG